MSKRLAWLDTARFLGIFLVFLFHNGEHTGYMHAFSIQVCLHLFFLLSGFSEQISHSHSWKECIAKNIRKLLIPYFLFSILTAVLTAIKYNTYTTVVPDAILILKGVPRGQFKAIGLWFLTCLFVIRLVFFVLHRYLKKPLYMLVVSLILYLIGNSIVSRGSSPLSYYNIDNALRFLLFYVIGYLLFNWIHSIMELNTLEKKIVFASIAIISGAYTMLTFWEKKPLFDLCSFSQPLLLLVDIIHPLILSSFILVLAKLIEDVGFLQVLGRETLYLCGSEHLINSLLSATILYFGVIPNYVNAFSPYIYVMVMLVVGHHIFVPFEKAILKKLGC